MLEHAELIDYSGHASMRRDAQSFYINSAASVRSALTVADLVAVDLEGTLQHGNARPPMEYPLHAEIYRARSDVGAIVHTHPKWSTLLTMVGAAVRPVFPQGCLLGDVPVVDSPLSVNTREMGERVARALGDGPAVLLKSHGAVLTGADMRESFVRAVYLEENARRQYLAMQIGSPYVFSRDEQEACRSAQRSPALFRKAWDYHRAKLG